MYYTNGELLNMVKTNEEKAFSVITKNLKDKKYHNKEILRHLSTSNKNLYIKIIKDAIKNNYLDSDILNIISEIYCISNIDEYYTVEEILYIFNILKVKYQKELLVNHINNKVKLINLLKQLDLDNNPIILKSFDKISYCILKLGKDKLGLNNQSILSEYICFCPQLFYYYKDIFDSSEMNNIKEYLQTERKSKFNYFNENLETTNLNVLYYLLFENKNLDLLIKIMEEISIGDALFKETFMAFTRFIQKDVTSKNNNVIECSILKTERFSRLFNDILSHTILSVNELELFLSICKEHSWLGIIKNIIDDEYKNILYYNTLKKFISKKFHKVIFYYNEDTKIDIIEFIPTVMQTEVTNIELHPLYSQRDYEKLIKEIKNYEVIKILLTKINDIYIIKRFLGFNKELDNIIFDVIKNYHRNKLLYNKSKEEKIKMLEQRGFKIYNKDNILAYKIVNLKNGELHSKWDSSYIYRINEQAKTNCTYNCSDCRGLYFTTENSVFENMKWESNAESKVIIECLINIDDITSIRSTVIKTSKCFVLRKLNKNERGNK